MPDEVVFAPSDMPRICGLRPLSFIRTALLVFFAFAATVSLPETARAWGCEGHQVIALVAEKHLTPHALATVNQLLKDNPIDPSLSRFCKEGGIDPMADASTWADDFRTQHPETGPWHYIDIPLSTSSRGGAKDIQKIIEKFCDPQESCVTRAIADQLATLRSPDSSQAKKANALRFLIHFVGDQHQPLHATTNNDQGGNCVPVTYFDDRPQLRNPQTESYAPNLHGAWDYSILSRATKGQTVDQVASDLDQSFHGKMAGWQKGPADFDAWSWESFQIAKKQVYGKLPARIPVETPQPITSCADDNRVSARMLKLDERLLETYQDMAVPVVRERLAQAGARLAMVLNQILA
jgi:hypothetical protein